MFFLLYRCVLSGFFVGGCVVPIDTRRYSGVCLVVDSGIWFSLVGLFGCSSICVV